jgi:4-diphosphocytidyl-2-C-methyl-D-erythritol kinase
MATRVRSYSKINLGLAIGPVRGDGFHGLVTLYQTLDLHDVVTVRARRAAETKIELTTNHPFVPRDARNTAWKMVEGALGRLGVTAEVSIHIEKGLPVQGGLGAGSANAAAALIGLERELGVKLPEVERLALAAEVGSDVPLFLVGGAVLGTGRGEVVEAVGDFPGTACLVVAPEVGVSTPAAFRAWDAKKQLSGVSSQLSVSGSTKVADLQGVGGLTEVAENDTLKELSHAYASVFGVPGAGPRVEDGQLKPDTSGIVSDLEPPAGAGGVSERAQRGSRDDLAENALLSLVRTGVENDFEEVVFPEYPSLREIKRLLMGIETGAPALYAALSGSGSALFGLYRSTADAEAAQQRVQAAAFEFGVKTFVTETLPRPEYWARMFAG